MQRLCDIYLHEEHGINLQLKYLAVWKPKWLDEKCDVKDPEKGIKKKTKRETNRKEKVESVKENSLIYSLMVKI